jgi:hypothetical protein
MGGVPKSTSTRRYAGPRCHHGTSSQNTQVPTRSPSCSSPLCIRWPSRYHSVRGPCFVPSGRAHHCAGQVANTSQCLSWNRREVPGGQRSAVHWSSKGGLGSGAARTRSRQGRPRDGLGRVEHVEDRRGRQAADSRRRCGPRTNGRYRRRREMTARWIERSTELASSGDRACRGVACHLPVLHG